MKTFTDYWRTLNWDDLRLRINSKTAADVERALNATRLTRDDLMALLSPAASAYLEPLAQKAQRLTRQRFRQGVNGNHGVQLCAKEKGNRQAILSGGRRYHTVDRGA